MCISMIGTRRSGWDVEEDLVLDDVSSVRSSLVDAQVVFCQKFARGRAPAHCCTREHTLNHQHKDNCPLIAKQNYGG